MSAKRDLMIYHPQSGAYIRLSDTVYLVDAADLDEETTAALSEGAPNISERDHKGYRLDNYNMGNLFYEN